MDFRRPLIRFLTICLLSVPSLLKGQEVNILASETQGCDTLTVNFSYTTTLAGVTSIEWDFGNGLTGNSENPDPVFYSEPGLYSIELRLNNSYFDEIDIFVRPNPNSFFQYADTLEPGSYTFVFRAPPQLTDTFEYAYLWRFPGNKTYNSRFVVHQFDSAGLSNVGLIVTDNFGCKDTTVRRIRVFDDIYVPNVFTPNDDGINDKFVVQTNGRTRYLFQIFSRSGILVYETEAYYLEWDGRNFSGIKLNPGVYYYLITPVEPPDELSKKGFIHLFR